MHKDACCSDSGLGRWICPTVVSVVAGAIVVAAGAMKFLGGKAMLTAVGGMALSVVDVSGHAQLALILWSIAATIEVVAGISFGIGCRRTSRWAALLLSVVMGVSVLFILTHLKPLQGDNLLVKWASLLGQIRLELLLFAVFFQKALRLIKSWLGMGHDCCSVDLPKKK